MRKKQEQQQGQQAAAAEDEHEAEDQFPADTDVEAALINGGEQVTPKRSTLLTVCPYILGNELCERLAYYGLATNLVTYITQVMGGDPAFAAILVAMFEGVCYTTPIIAALLADSLWGRYKTIFVFSLIYLVGILMLTGSSLIPDSDEDAEKANPLQFGVLFGSLAVISLGTGGIKPNVSAFGADQFDETDPQDCREKQSFFNWFYLAINVGSLIAGTVIVYIQDSLSWTIGFAVPGCAMALAILLFWAGSPGYRHVLPTESPMERVAKVVWAALKNRWRKKHRSPSGQMDGQTDALLVVSNGNTPCPSYHGSNQYEQLMAKEYGANPTQLAVEANGGSSGSPASLHRTNSMFSMPCTSSMSYRWLEDAVTDWQTSQGKRVHMGGLAGYTPKQVEEVKLVLRLLPIFGATVLYWTIYTQMGTLFVQQGNLMDRAMELPAGRGSINIPSASMSIFNTLSIILLIWLYDSYFEPALQRTKNFKMTKLRRQGWGMLIAALAMVYAGMVEVWRLRKLPQDISATDSSDGSQGSPGYKPNEPAHLSIFWQAPAYFLIGLSEVFTSIGQLEFFYDQAPDVMRSCSMAMCLLSTALGSYLAGALTWAVQAGSESITGTPWLPNDLNKGRMDLFYFFLAALMALNLAAFVAVAVRYQYKRVLHRRAKLAISGSTIYEDHEAEEDAPSLQRSTTAPGNIVPHPADGPRTQQRRPAQQGRQRVAATAAAAAAGTAPLSIGPAGRRGPHARGARQAEEEEDIYGRSLAYVPPSPNIPAPFR